MSFPRKKVKWSPSNQLEFLCIDWIECDETIYEEYSKEDYFNKNDDEGVTEEEKKHNKFYTIFVFGITIEGYSVCAKIINYQPYFYVKIPYIFKEKPKLKKKFIKEFFEKPELNFSKINTYNKIDEKITSTNPKISNDASYLLKMRDKLESSEYKSALDESKICEKNSEIFWSFTNNQKYDFWKLSFQSKEGYHLFSSFMKINKHFPKMYDKKSETKKPHYLDFKLFESELEPLLRFFHDMKIKPSNWIKFNKRSYKMKPNMSSCQINVEIDYQKVIAIDKQEIPPIIVASYDIECDSSHGDFPLAKKDYKKLANELVVSYLNKKIKLNKIAKSSQEYKELSDELKTHIFFKKRIIQAFDLEKQYYLHQKKEDETEEERLELSDKLQPKIDNEISKVYFKVRDIKSKKDNKIIIENYLKTEKFNTLCKEILFICDRPIKKIIANQKMKAAITSINIQYERKEEYRIKTYKQDAKPCSIHDLISIIKTVSKKTKFSFENLKIKILGKDVLVKYVNQELRCSFPQVKGDKVIQIGTVFWRYGDDKPIYNNIITLKECAPIPNVDVYSFTKERDVLLEWTKMIRNYDPDIILGYNIFGFDEVFMFDRANELIAKGNVGDTKYQKFINMGRLNADTYKNIWNCKGKLLKKKLASSALGANYLEYFNTPGRVQIDLLKVIQGGLTKLDSYKLDSVAEFYICGKILKVGRSEYDDVINESQWLHITNIKELEVGNYLIITLKTGEKVENGTKFIIEELDVENEYIKLNEPISASINSQAPKWGIAKDDVTPKQIFEFQKGTNEQRAIVAKYCIQDCALVIRLLKKLDTIVNNFGMSNVCIVPFSYIFMRGQGIKIFSLVVNECSESGFLLPTLDKVWTDKGEDDDIVNSVGEDEAIEVGETTLQNETLSNLVGRDDIDDGDEGNTKFTLGDDFNKININGDGYEGAIVLEPMPGIYIDDPITVLDFSSLYPSEMIASNLSHDSHCEDEYWLGDEGGRRIKALGYDYLDVEYDVFSWIDPKNHNKGKQKTGVTTERFVQYNDGKKGLIPNIERKLLGARKATKKKMKEERDPFKQSILDGLQLAYKVTANSLYGQIGASTSKIYKKAIAASTTAGGRRCIYRAKDYCLKNNPGCEVVYGDSVTKDTPLLLKNKITNEIEIKQIDELGDIEWSKYDNFKINDITNSDKLQNKCDNYLIYTSNGWSNIKRIIKHKTTKKIYRVTTHTGIVDITEDHSLLDEDLNPIKPLNANVGMKLKHNYPEFDNNTINLEIILNIINNIYKYDINFKEAFIYGFFFGDGSCGKYNCPSGIKYSWGLNQKSYKMCSILQSILIDVFGDYFSIYNTLNSSNIYKIAPRGSIKKYVNLFRNICYNKDKYKIIPLKYLNGDINLRIAYFAGYYAADEYKCLNTESKNIILSNKGKIGTSMLYYLMKSIGLKVSVNTRKDKNNIFKLTGTNKKQRKHPNEIKKIEYIKTINNDEYVYDIETDVGNFNSGFPLIVKNTDSVFVKFNLVYEDGTYPQTDLDKVQRSIDIGLELQKKLKDDKYFTPPHDLEYEKVFYPLMLITKKRYAGEKFEFDASSSAFTSMGIVLKRRDNAPILKHAYGGVMKKIMKEKNIESAIEFVRLCCQEIIDNKYELNMFVISKTLRDYYKDPESIAHKVLANRMGERDPGNKPASNERIPYAYIKVEEKAGVKLLQGDKIEHVNYITENDLQLDYYIYIKNQLLKPICQIFELVVENMKGYPYHANHFENLWDIYYEKYKGDKKKTDKKISEEKQKVVAKLIFKEYMILAHNKQNKVNTLDGWLQIINDAFDDNNENKEDTLEDEVDNSKTESTTKQVKNTVVKKKLKRQTAISDFF